MALGAIPRDKFEPLHTAFLAYMAERGGTPFTSFDHAFFYEDEVQYKTDVAAYARRELNLKSWRERQVGTGELLDAVRRACAPGISRNLLEHKYGAEQGSYKALYLVKSQEERAGLEEQLFTLLANTPSDPARFGPALDAFANYLRDHQLGAGWDFVAYLAFLRDEQRYFPIRSTRFQRLFDHFGYDVQLPGRVEWGRYAAVLELAALLRTELADRGYGWGTAIQLQSYMWVISSQHVDELAHLSRRLAARDLDPDAELERRLRAAQQRERRGFAGERVVLEHERRRLKAIGRGDLARRVELVAVDGGERTYDVRSFDAEGGERRIEVKATASTAGADDGFWLSEGERARGATDDRWRVYRVHDVDGTPAVTDLGNVVRDGGWQLAHASWRVTQA